MWQCEWLAKHSAFSSWAVHIWSVYRSIDFCGINLSIPVSSYVTLSIVGQSNNSFVVSILTLWWESITSLQTDSNDGLPSGSLLKVTSQLISEWISLMLSPGFVSGLVHIWRKHFCFSWSQHFFSMACQIVGAQHFRCNPVILNVELYWFMASEQFHQCFFKDSFGDMLW